MSWTKETQARMDDLRDKELTGTLTSREQAELAGLMAQVEAEEARTLAPAVARLRTEVTDLEEGLAKVQDENKELARVLAQQQSLAADGRRFLAEFDQRHASILDALARFAGGPLPVT